MKKLFKNIGITIFLLGSICILAFAIVAPFAQTTWSVIYSVSVMVLYVPFLGTYGDKIIEYLTKERLNNE